MLLFAIINVGCSPKGTYVKVTNYRYIATGAPTLKAEVIKTWKFSDREVVETILKSLSDIKAANVYYDIAPPPYVAQVYKNGTLSNEYSIWLGDTRGIVWLNNTWYHMSEKANEELKLLWE